MELDIEQSDSKQYTLILKDELLPKSLNGREQSTISWEYDFKPSNLLSEGSGRGKLFFKFDELKPTYRGREKTGAKPLDLKNIKRISLMMRSFFGTQKSSDFSLSIISISAQISLDSKTSSDVPDAFQRYLDDPSQTEKEIPRDEGYASGQRPRSWLGWLSSFCLGPR